MNNVNGSAAWARKVYQFYGQPATLQTSDLRQIAKLAPAEKKIEVVQYCMEGASKALVAYIPAIVPATS